MEMRGRLRLLRNRLSAVTLEPQDAVALQALAPLSGPFLPWTGFTMRPAAILAVVTDVHLFDRRSIVECGSGTSTIYLARLLRQRDSPGHVTSIDHDEQWAQMTVDQLRREGLSDLVTVVHAPLVDGWYDRAALPDVAPIDLLVVDGPPAYAKAIEFSREPALAEFGHALTEDATVILDDAERAGEREVLRRWVSDHGRRFTTERGGFAISTPYMT